MSGNLKLLKTVLILIIILFTQCEDETYRNEESEIIFEKVYVNMAWEYQYSHWIIDNSGNVRLSRKTDLRYLGPPVSEVYFSEFDSIVFTIPEKELEYYFDLAYKAKDGTYQSEIRNGADFGSLEFNIYILDSKKDIYNKCLLSLQSDLLDSINVDYSAIEIVQWLSTINGQIYSK